MLVTEAEAREKLCQETFGKVPPGLHQKEHGAARIHYCVGSGCMAWRWVNKHIDAEEGEAGAYRLGDRWVRLVQSDKGHCGKAGG